MSNPGRIVLGVQWHTVLRCPELTETVPTHFFPSFLNNGWFLDPGFKIFREIIRTHHPICEPYSFIAIFYKIPWDKANKMTFFTHVRLLCQILMKLSSELDGADLSTLKHENWLRHLLVFFTFYPETEINVEGRTFLLPINVEGRTFLLKLIFHARTF